eukprot:Nitzschia sp. Nitz4//scaffold10_size219509//178977//180194//NITZ4_001456-RA/size219509-processed-gene-0.94-mRNA-1//1//CDS//3329533004//2914//frame0
MPPIAVDHSPARLDSKELTDFLDKQADTDGLKNVNYENEDWTDVKHSERKKRDRILDDGVLIGLMKKSDAKGFERLFTNLGIMALTATAIRQVVGEPSNVFNLSADRMLLFLALYFFFGFQYQCFAFAGQHEFLHRNAFKTKWINDLCLFYTGVFTFEFGEHERVMHKQHHTFTNNIDRDPELTSYYSREVLENGGFRNLALSRWGYIREFLDIPTTFKCRLGRVFFSAMGIAVDYSGTGWSLKEWTYSSESGIMRTLQRTAIIQILHWIAMVGIFGRTHEGRLGLLFWWVTPVLLGYPVVNYVRNLEHADCEVSKDPNCLKNTRSVRSNIFVRTLLWDTNFHAEHHCYPMVPFYNLHKINNEMYDHIIHKECDYFVSQNWTAFKSGGWIDQQSAAMADFARKAE